MRQWVLVCRSIYGSYSKDGTTHVILEPLDFIARLAALVPKPRVDLTRFARIIQQLRRIFVQNKLPRSKLTGYYGGLYEILRFSSQ